MAAPNRDGKIVAYVKMGGPETARSRLDRWPASSIRLRVVTAAMTDRYVIAPFDAHSNRTIAAV